MKTCKKCELDLDESNFYLNWTKKSYLNYCKKCHKERVRAYHRVDTRPTTRARFSPKSLESLRKSDREYQRKKRLRNPEAKKLQYDAYVKKYPKRDRANRLVRYAVKTGKIKKQSCQEDLCTVKNTHAHHPDYKKPLEVIWLCPSHHKKAHHKD